VEQPGEMVNSGDETASVWRGRLWVLLAAVMWSTSGFFAKAPWFAGWPGPVLAFWRALFASLLLVVCIRRVSWSWGLVPMVAIFAAMSATYLTAMSRAEASVAIWLQNTAPMWVFLLGVFWLREPVERRDWVLVALCGLGIAIIVAHQVRHASPDAVAYGLASGVLYAGVVLSLRRLRRHDPTWLVALNHLGTSLVLAPVALQAPVWPQGFQWFYLAAFGMFQLGAPYVFMAKGLQTVPSHQAALIALIEPLLVPLWVYVAWRNHPGYQAPSVWTMLGGACILIGLMYRHLGLPRGWMRLARESSPAATAAQDVAGAEPSPPGNPSTRRTRS
jgi:DME family drug/metabolite transporter